VAGEAGGRFVVDDELALTRADGEIRPAQQGRVKVIAEESGGVDDEPGPEAALAGGQRPQFAVKVAARDRTGPQKDCAVGEGLGQIGVRRRPRVDEIFARDAEGRAGAGAKVGFEGIERSAAEGFDIGHAVRMGLIDQLGKRCLFLVRPGDDKGAGRVERQAEVVADREVFGISGGDASLFERAGRRIEAGVENRRIGL